MWKEAWVGTVYSPPLNSPALFYLLSKGKLLYTVTDTGEQSNETSISDYGVCVIHNTVEKDTNNHGISQTTRKVKIKCRGSSKGGKNSFHPSNY